MREKATIEGFGSTIAYSVWGGNDTLNLFDSPGDDKVVLRSHKAEMGPRQAETPVFTGRGFALVHAVASAGAENYDYVRMHDTELVDLLVAGYLEGETWATLSKPADGSAMVKMYDALGFDVVKAVNDYGDSPRNKKDVDAAVDFPCSKAAGTRLSLLRSGTGPGRQGPPVVLFSGNAPESSED